MTDSNGEVVDDYQGATGACPEYSFTDGIADGEYDIMANLYAGLSTVPGIDEYAIPMTVKIFKGGVISDTETTVRYSTADYPSVPAWTTLTEDGPTVNVGKLRIASGKLTLIAPDGAEIGTIDQ